MIPALSTPQQVDASATLRRQLHLSPEPLQPGTRPLQRDVRGIADLVLEKLRSLAGHHCEYAAIEALHHTLVSSEPSLEVSVEELQGYYAFFKKAEHLLERYRSPKAKDIEADYTLCRALKWQFRAAVSEDKHQHLTQNLLPALAYVKNGGNRSNHRHIGYNLVLDPTLQNRAGPQWAVDSRLEITADQRVRSSRAISLLAQLNVSVMEKCQLRGQCGIGWLSSGEYASLEQYADARSHSVRTSL